MLMNGKSCLIPLLKKVDFLNKKILSHNNFCMLSVDQAFCESLCLYYIHTDIKTCFYIYTQKTVEGYLDSIPSFKSNTIQTNQNMHTFHTSRCLQLRCMFNLSHASMVKVQSSSMGLTLYTEKSQTFKND